MGTERRWARREKWKVLLTVRSRHSHAGSCCIFIRCRNFCAGVSPHLGQCNCSGERYFHWQTCSHVFTTCGKYPSHFNSLRYWLNKKNNDELLQVHRFLGNNQSLRTSPKIFFSSPTLKERLNAVGFRCRLTLLNIDFQLKYYTLLCRVPSHT